MHRSIPLNVVRCTGAVLAWCKIVEVVASVANLENYCWPSGVVVFGTDVHWAVLHSSSGESVSGIGGKPVAVEMVVGYVGGADGIGLVLAG